MAELWPWLRLLLAHRRRLLIGGLLMLATVLAGIGLLALSGWFITATALTGALLAAGINANLNIYVPGGGIRFFALARTVSRYLERLYNHDTVLRLLSDIRVTFFGGLASTRRPAAARRSTDWLTRLTRDIDTLDTLYLQLVAPPALALLALGMIALAMLFIAPRLLWSLAPLVLLLPMLYVLARTTMAPGQRQGFEEEALRGRLVDALEGMGELQAAHQWQAEANDLLANSQTLNRTTMTLEKPIAIARGMTLLAIQISVLVGVWVGIQLWREGALSGPVALMFTLAILGLGEAFTNLPNAFGRVGTTIGAASRLNSEQPPAAPNAPGTVPATKRGALSLDSVTTDLQGDPLFGPVNVRLEPGERLALLGRSGSGKSTLLDYLAGLGGSVRGEVRVGDTLVRPSGDETWLSGVSYLSQRTHFFSDSLRANLAMANPSATDDELRAVLEAVELSELLSALPQGLDTWIGDQGRLLSGGERRRIALARSLLRPGWLLLLDEPFTGVDEPTRERIKTRIEPWLANRTCIYAAHHDDALPRADVIIRLDEPRHGQARGTVTNLSTPS